MADAVESQRWQDVAPDTTVTMSFAVPPGDNRLLHVVVPVDSQEVGVGAYSWCDGATYGGQAMTAIASNGLDRTQARRFRLVAPPVGTADIVAAIGGDPGALAGVVIAAVALTGVDQTTPVSASSGGSGTTALQRTVASAVGGLVLATCVSTTDAALTHDAGQAETWAEAQTGLSGDGNFRFAGASKPGAASVTVGFSKGPATDIAVGADAVAPAAGSSVAVAQAAEPAAGQSSLALRLGLGLGD